MVNLSPPGNSPQIKFCLNFMQTLVFIVVYSLIKQGKAQYNDVIDGKTLQSSLKSETKI